MSSRMPTPVTTSAGHEALVQRFMQVINAGDIAGFSDVIANDYVQHNPMVPQGLAGIQAGFQAFQYAFADLEARVDAVVADGDQVVARFTWSGTHVGDFMGVVPTGGHVTWTSMDWWRVADGKLAEHWDQIDWQGLLEQLHNTAQD